MKYKYKLNNLDCPKCAAKIETILNNHKDIINASINFSKLELTIETNKDKNIKEFISKQIKEINPEVKVLELNENINNKKTIKLKTLRIFIGIITSLLGIFVIIVSIV